jgi:putative chitinase
MFDEKIYFDMVRGPLFGGSMSQEQVDGQKFILASWDRDTTTTDLRWLAYSLATTKHETASTMLPIEEYGKGQGMEYGKIDPVTGQGYWGRGFVQLTWRDNYAKADRELGLTGDKSCEWHAENALDPKIAADIMFKGMDEGWFRKDKNGPQTLLRYFDADLEDPYNAREIINGDKTVVPSWSDGKSIGKLIAGYYDHFLAAVTSAYVSDTSVSDDQVTIDITTTGRGTVIIRINGETIWAPPA